MVLCGLLECLGRCADRIRCLRSGYGAHCPVGLLKRSGRQQTLTLQHLLQFICAPTNSSPASALRQRQRHADFAVRVKAAVRMKMQNN
eukprot:41409-Pelagomonas_calceolata.AAC.2